MPLRWPIVFSPSEKARQSEADARYRKSEKGSKRRHEYDRRRKQRPEVKAILAEAQRRYRAKEGAKEVIRRQQARRRFGITDEEYADLTGSPCAICGAPPPSCIDHDHETGIVRGALCSNCNAGLGLLQDDLRVVEAAADYLEKALGWSALAVAVTVAERVLR